MTPSPQKRTKKISAQRVVLTSFLVDVLDVVINVSSAIITGSVVMLAEALQGFSELVSTGFVLIGLKRSARPPDRRHPLGHGKELFVWVLFASLVMLVAISGLAMYFGIQRLLSPEPIAHIWVAFVVLAIAVCTNSYSLSLGARRLFEGSYTNLWSRFVNSPLIETRTAVTVDAIGTAAALSGLASLGLYVTTGRAWFDGAGAIAIGAIMLVFSFVLLVSTKNLLVGRRIAPEEEKNLRNTILHTDGVTDIVRLITMVTGLGTVMVSVEIHAEDNLVTDELEELVDRIERNIRQVLPEAREIYVEFETPYSTEH